MKEGREFNETERSNDRLFSLEEIMSESDERTLSEDEQKELLQEIDNELLTEDERDELVMECIHKTGFRSVEKETLFQVAISGISIRGIHIDSDEILELIIKEQFPSLTEREDYDRLFDSTKSYLNLVERYSGRKSISSQEISELSVAYQLPKRIIKGWLCENRTPKLLVMLNQALSLDEAANLRADIVEQLNSLTSFEKAQERLENYYLWEKVQSFPKLEKYIEIASRFFRFFDTLSEGGLINDIARRSRVSKSDITRWVRHRQIPSLALLA